MRARTLLMCVLLMLTPLVAHAAKQGDACGTSNECEQRDDYCIDNVCRPIRWKPPRRPYGGEIVISDVAAIATLGTFSVFSGPIVHLIHRRPLTALASFGLRVGGIALGAGSGALIALALPPLAYNGQGCMNCPPSPNYLPQMFVGFLVGAGLGWIVSSILDATFLAHPRPR